MSEIKTYESKYEGRDIVHSYVAQQENGGWTTAVEIPKSSQETLVGPNPDETGITLIQQRDRDGRSATIFLRRGDLLALLEAAEKLAREAVDERSL